MTTTYGDVLDRYADLLDAGHADKDLTHQQRAYVTALLLCSARNARFVQYPPTSQQRATARMYVTGLVGSPTADIAAFAFADYAEWDASVTRALEIVTHA